jgi:hypothetical protein
VRERAATTGPAFDDAGGPPVEEITILPPFLRTDRPELDGTTMVLRPAIPEERARRKRDPRSPLGYLYEIQVPMEPETDIRLAAGHYDMANLVWVFSGDITTISGITEATPQGM